MKTIIALAVLALSFSATAMEKRNGIIVVYGTATEIRAQMDDILADMNDGDFNNGIYSCDFASPYEVEVPGGYSFSPAQYTEGAWTKDPSEVVLKFTCENQEND